MSRKTTKRRKRRGHYKTGIHSSKKCLNSPMHYRSGWELTVAKQFDSDASVASYEYESLKIPYVSNKKTKKVRNYIPDFLVTLTNGKKLIVEVKRQNMLNNIIIQKKTEAAKQWTSSHGMDYQIWTDVIIKAFQKIQKVKEKAQKPQKLLQQKKRQQQHPRAKQATK